MAFFDVEIIVAISFYVCWVAVGSGDKFDGWWCFIGWSEAMCELTSFLILETRSRLMSSTSWGGGMKDVSLSLNVCGLGCCLLLCMCSRNRIFFVLFTKLLKWEELMFARLGTNPKPLFSRASMLLVSVIAESLSVLLI